MTLQPRPSESDKTSEIEYVVEHGQSPEAEAARVLRRFMTCQAGTDLVEYGLLRPYGYTLDAGRVMQGFRMLDDEMDRLEALVAGVAQELHDQGHDDPASELARICESARVWRRRAKEAVA